MLIMPKFVEKNRLNMPSTRIRQEQEIVAQMVRIYCRQKEKHTAAIRHLLQEFFS